MNYNIIPDLPFKFTIGSGLRGTFTATSVHTDEDGWVQYDVTNNCTDFTHSVSVISMLRHITSGHWKIIKEENEMKKIKTTDLKGFVANEHRPYTDYNKDIADWLTENADRVDFTRHINPSCYIFTSRGGEFYSHYNTIAGDVYYTNEEFKEWIGMTKKEEKLVSNTMPKLVAGKHWVVVENEGHGGIGLITINNMIQYIKGEDGAVSNGFDSAEDVSRYIVEVREIADHTPPTFKSAKIVWKKVDQKQLAIQKELEFAKAKAERLTAHISVLESKLK